MLSITMALIIRTKPSSRTATAAMDFLVTSITSSRKRAPRASTVIRLRAAKSNSSWGVFSKFPTRGKPTATTAKRKAKCISTRATEQVMRLAR